MTWVQFPYFAVCSLILWIMGASSAWKGKRMMSCLLWAVGIVVYLTFILCFWFFLERPPMRTMGETRLWYVLFISVAGIVVYLRWRYKWILSFSFVMALVFTCLNLCKPEIHSKSLMPALQSPWFAPHVTVYMFAYALLGASALVAIYLLWIKKYPVEESEMALCDNLVGTGISFMTMGMLFGAIWAEQAWGHYWSWDPKETWAAATWFSYLSYIHLRYNSSVKDEDRTTAALFILLFSFVFLQMCWYGINFLPSAQGISVHTYNQ